ncbi:MAG: class I SAM-dependent methyltransferase [Dehalococcoidia bacterium]
MTTTGAQAWVADLYDDYVTATADIPFFLEAARGVAGPVLELMAGTGRISLPLAEAGVHLTCVDLSGSMLARLRAKLAAGGLRATVCEMDVARLDLAERAFPLILLPFQSFGELLDPQDQRSALDRIATHLADEGRFICTLHNPRVRRRTVDGQLRLLGTVPLSRRAGTLLLWSVQQSDAGSSVVRAGQIYEVYDRDGRLEEKRWLDVRFRLVEPAEFRSMAERAGFRVAALYGNYDRTPFDEEQSPYMIWVLERS